MNAVLLTLCAAGWHGKTMNAVLLTFCIADWHGITMNAVLLTLCAAGWHGDPGVVRQRVREGAGHCTGR